jgi:hypothetical protein
MQAWTRVLLAAVSLTVTSLFGARVSSAAEEPPSVTVLAVAGQPATAAFVESVRIQLTGIATVELGPLLSGASRQARAAQAHELLIERGGWIAVWHERAAGRSGDTVAVLAVTRHSGSKPIEVARSTSQSLDGDRVLALKVGELLHQVLSAARSEVELAAELSRRAPPERKESPAVPKPPPKSPLVGERALSLEFLIEGDGALRFDSHFKHPQVGVRGGLGAALRQGGRRLELLLSVRPWSELEATAANGRLTVRQLDASAALRGLTSAGPLSLGLSLEAVAATVRGSALAGDGRRGSATKLGAALLIGPEARLRLVPARLLSGPALEMRVAAMLETTLYAQRFAIEGIPVRVRENSGGYTELGLIAILP